MAFDQAKFAAKAKAALAVASTPAFTPDPDNAAACAQVKAAVADAQKRAAVHSIAIAVAERAEELWPGIEATADDMAAAAQGACDLDCAAYAAIGAYLTTVKE